MHSTRLLFVAAITRVFTLSVSRPPTRSNFCSCSTRSTFACVERLMSPISSRKIVPPCACSNFPIFVCDAPVNAPRS
jgi:hypothetical protein